MAELTLFLADGEDVLRRGLRSLFSLRRGWTVCGEAKSGLDAVKLTLQLNPDVVILGFELPDLNGIEAPRQIKRARPDTEILFYTGNNEEHIVGEALQAGARGHVLKTDSEGILIEAVEALSRHSPYLSTTGAE